MELLPTALSINDQGYLCITWSDDSITRHRPQTLRDVCPCATCREKRKATEERPVGILPVLTLAEAAPLTITKMRPVGNYAYNIQFSDGHDSGIYSFEFLRNAAVSG